MKIADLKLGMREVSVNGKIIEKTSPVVVKSKFGSYIPLSIAVVEDETGAVNLSLWGRQIEQVNIGDNLFIENAIVKEFNGKLRLTVPKLGMIRKQKS